MQVSGPNLQLKVLMVLMLHCITNKEIAFKTNAGALDGIPIGTCWTIFKSK